MPALLITLALCVLNLLVMHYYLLSTTHFLWSSGNISLYIENLLGCLFDVSLLYIIGYCLSARKEKAALTLCFSVTLLWSFANVVYSRFFGQYLSLSAIGQAAALGDESVFSSVMSGFRLSDCYYLMATALFIFIIRKGRTSARSMRKVAALLLFSLVYDALALGVYCVQGQPKRLMGAYFNRHFSFRDLYCFPSMSHFVKGSSKTIMFQMADNARGTLQLTESQLSDIRQTEAEARQDMTQTAEGARVQKQANVIFILVESYMAFTADMTVDGREVTPMLNALRRDSTVFYTGQMQENVTIGESSDGQFIYMTGLLPLRSAITISKARHATLPGLPKMLAGRRSRMVIPTTASMWNQDDMCRQYGFDELYSSQDYADGSSSTLNDEQVFQLAMQHDAEQPRQPFFSVILTMSMHQPYTQQTDPTFPVTGKDMNKELAFYLNACHYTDRQIAIYFDHLRQTGLYDNSLIVITADHPVHNTDFGGVSHDIPLYIVNLPQELKQQMWQGACNQIDVYTTLLDILGVESRWYGLGQSLLSPRYQSAIVTRKWDISEWIIRGDYFSSPHARE